MMRRRTLSQLLALLIVPAFGLACGGGDSADADAGEAETMEATPIEPAEGGNPAHGEEGHMHVEGDEGPAHGEEGHMHVEGDEKPDTAGGK